MYRFTRTKKMVVVCVLLFVFLFPLINTFIWLSVDNTYLMYDAQHHYLWSCALFQQIKSHLLPNLHILLTSPEFDHRWHGIFVPLSTTPFYFLFGSSQDNASMIGAVIFWIMLLYAVYGIGKKIGGNSVGLLAGFILSVYPIIFLHMRLYMYDLPLTALVSISFYWLLQTQWLENKRACVYFALACSCGLLTKANFLGFVFIPFLYVLYVAAIKRRMLKGKRIIILISFIVTIPLVILFPFLKYKAYDIWQRFYECSWFNPLFWGGDHISISVIVNWFLTGIRYILWAMYEIGSSMTSCFFFILFLFGCIRCWRLSFPEKTILILWMCIPVLLLAYLFHMPLHNRYIMPILPVMALITSLGIFSVRTELIRKSIVVCIVIFGIYQYYAISFPWIPGPEEISISLPFGINKEENVYIPLFSRHYSAHFRTDHDMQAYPVIEQSAGEYVWGVIEREPLFDSNQRRLCEPRVFLCDYMPDIFAVLTYLIDKKNSALSIMDQRLTEEKYFTEKENSFAPLYMLEQPDYIVSYDSFYIPEGMRLKKSIIDALHMRRRVYLSDTHNYFQLKKKNLSDGRVLSISKKRSPYKRFEIAPVIGIAGNGFLDLFYERDHVGFVTYYLTYKNKLYIPTSAKWKQYQNKKDVLLQGAVWKGEPLEILCEQKKLSPTAILFRISVHVREACAFNNVCFLADLSNDYTLVHSGDIDSMGEGYRGYKFTNFTLSAKITHITFRSVKNIDKVISFDFHSNDYIIESYISVNRSHNVFHFLLINGQTQDITLEQGTHHLFDVVVNVGENEDEKKSAPEE